jgi:hypothetical protein
MTKTTTPKTKVYTYTPSRTIHAFDRVLGHLLGVVVQIEGSKVTYRATNGSLHTIAACLVTWGGED